MELRVFLQMKLAEKEYRTADETFGWCDSSILVRPDVGG
jgi:hypothetical protein